MLLLLCTIRGRCKAPGLRPRKGSPLRHRVPFAFTTPLGLVRPMARTHVRLLGPCFKTGRRGRRPTRDRDADRPSERACYTSRLRYPPPAETGAGGSPPVRTTNFTPVLVPQTAVRRVKSRRSAAADRADRNEASSRIALAPAARPPT